MSASIPSSRACYSAICRTSSGTWSIRARATAGCRFPLNASRASAHSQSTPVTSFERVIAAFLPLRRRLREPVELRGPSRLRAPALFSSHDGPLRLIQNFCRRFGSGKPSFLCSLVQNPQKPGRSVAQTFRISPVPVLSLVAVHAVNLTEDRKHEVPKKCGF